MADRPAVATATSAGRRWRAIEQHLTEIAALLAELNRRHRHEHESLPAVLQRLEAIERQLGLVEKPAAPKSSRRRPLGV